MIGMRRVTQKVNSSNFLLHVFNAKQRNARLGELVVTLPSPPDAIVVSWRAIEEQVQPPLSIDAMLDL